MKIFISLVGVICSVVILSGCASEIVKAPCDQNASFCGPKIKINQW